VTGTVIPLDAIRTVRSARKAPSRPASAAVEPGAPSPRRTDGPDPRLAEHPCYSEDGHQDYARMHVAVAPACNIQCHYCNRKYDCANESRPGVTSRRLTPEEAAKRVLLVAARTPQLSVLGIAGPGDALYDHQKTFETFDRGPDALPDLRLCLSTNGLALPDHVDRIKALGIDHVTITINMVDPAIGEGIYAWAFHGRRRMTGREASEVLHARQMEGLSALAEAGILVKVNSVLIPGVNDTHLGEVHDAVMSHGATLHNIVPLISDAAHGTYYGLNGYRGPTDLELQGVREQMGNDARLMKHCRQCRADAVGMLGTDESATIDALAEESTEDLAALAKEATTKRRAYRALVDREREDRRAATEAAAADLAACTSERKMTVAVCTRAGGRVNQHFGKTKEFSIYEAGRTGIRFLGIRKAGNYCQGGEGDDGALSGIVETLAGVEAILCAKIGNRPRRDLAAAGITAVDAYPQAYVETALAALFRAAEAETGTAAPSPALPA
jgi:nitrogen fixation protein NifB